MAVLYKSNVEEAISNKPDSITAFNLAVAAIDSTGLRNVLAAYADSDQLPYFASDNAGLWEQGIGTVTGTTLVRTVVNESSSANAAVDFSAGGAINLHVEVSANLGQSANDRFNSGFSVCRITSDITLASATTTKITGWDAPTYNPDTLFNPTTGEFTVPKTGRWRVTGKVKQSGLSNVTGIRTITRLLKNNAVYLDFFRSRGLETVVVIGGSVIETFIAGDVLALATYYSSSLGTVVVPGIDNNVSFSAEYLGE